jgi:hypothetical protein
MSHPAALRVLIGCLVLNEQQWILPYYYQHRDWPGLGMMVFVEAADTVYTEANPDLVSPDGLSTDGTTQLLESLAAADPRVRHIKFGTTSHPTDSAQGKCAARNAYLELADHLHPDIILTLDADEFVPKSLQEMVNKLTQRNPYKDGVVIRHRDIWWPPSSQEKDGTGAYPKPEVPFMVPGISQQHGSDPEPPFKMITLKPPSFAHEVVGGFWDIPYCRIWRWSQGMRYSANHNTPSTASGRMLDRSLLRADLPEARATVRGEPTPYYIHTAFASSLASRRAKHQYYSSRGEAEPTGGDGTWIAGQPGRHGSQTLSSRGEPG